MRRTRGHLVIGALLALTLVAAACGGSNKTSSGTTAAPGTPSDETPVAGGTLTMGLEAETTGGWCLPEAQLAAGGIAVANAIFEPLMAYDENYEPKPYLAEALTPDAAYTNWTLKLRPNVTFHDGTPLNATIVKLNIDLWRGDDAAKAATGRQPLLLPFVFNNVASVTVVDDLTLTIVTKTPWKAFPATLAGGRFGVAGEAQLKGDKANCAENLIGTGPFKKESWTRNQQLVTVKNPNYWRKDDKGNQLPYLDKLVFKPLPGGTDRLQSLQGKTVNAAHFSGQNEFDAIQKESDTLTFIPEVEGHKEVGYGLVNVSKPPFNDLAVRKAFAQAIDRAALNDINSGGKFATANQPFDTKVLGYVPDLKLPDYNPEEAAKVLKGKGITFSLAYASDPNTKLIAEDIKRQLEQVGVTVEIDTKDQATLINQALGGNFNVLLWRNHPGVDPDSQSVWWKSGSPVNFGKINDPELDALLDKGRSSTDDAERATTYQAVAKLFADKVYNLWNWYTSWGVGTDKTVRQLGYWTLPDGSKGSGLNWGWTYWTQTWIKQ